MAQHFSGHADLHKSSIPKDVVAPRRVDGVDAAFDMTVEKPDARQPLGDLPRRTDIWHVAG